MLGFRFYGSLVHSGSWVVQGFGSSESVVQLPCGVGARTVTDLDCWKLANELKLGGYGLIKSGDAAKDFEFKNQIRNAAASAPRNIAEGFGRYQPREMSQYLRVANGSLMETANHLLQDGVDRGYFESNAVAPLLITALRASASTTRLIRYLQTARASTAPNPRTRTT